MVTDTYPDTQTHTHTHTHTHTMTTVTLAHAPRVNNMFNTLDSHQINQRTATSLTCEPSIQTGNIILCEL